MSPRTPLRILGRTHGRVLVGGTVPSQKPKHVRLSEETSTLSEQRVFQFNKWPR